MTKGKKCHRCKQEGHFQICCKTKLKKDKSKQGKSKVHWVESASGNEPDDEQIFIIGNKLATIDVQIAGKSINMLIDSGASCNVIDSNTWKTRKSNVKLNKCDRNVYAYGSKSPLHVIGKFDTNISFNDQKRNAEFLVVNTNCGSL